MAASAAAVAASASAASLAAIPTVGNGIYTYPVPGCIKMTFRFHLNRSDVECLKSHRPDLTFCVTLDQCVVRPIYFVRLDCPPYRAGLEPFSDRPYYWKSLLNNGSKAGSNAPRKPPVCRMRLRRFSGTLRLVRVRICVLYLLSFFLCVVVILTFPRRTFKQESHNAFTSSAEQFLRTSFLILGFTLAKYLIMGSWGLIPDDISSGYIRGTWGRDWIVISGRPVSTVLGLAVSMNGRLW